MISQSARAAPKSHERRKYNALGLPEIQAYNGSLESRHGIEELPTISKQIVPSIQPIVILKTHRLGPWIANLPSSPLQLKVILSETAIRGPSMKFHFKLRGPYPIIYFHIDCPRKEKKLAEARLELKLCRAKGKGV